MVALSHRCRLLTIFPFLSLAVWPFSGDDGSTGVEPPRIVVKSGGALPAGAPNGLPPFMQQLLQGGGTLHGGVLPGPFLLQAGAGGPQHLGGGGGPRVLVMQGSFGFDPWEDLHRNIERVVHQTMSEDDGGRGLLARPTGDSAPLGPRLESLLDVFGGQHQGHVGRADGQFEVDGNDTHFHVSATLPGYKLGGGGDRGQSPLTVRLVGHRSLVVSGSQQAGAFVKTWQRSFALPRGSWDLDATSVTYNAESGFLSVDVPRREGDEASEAGEDGDPGERAVPPALQAIRTGLPDLLAALSAQPRGGQGFLIPGGRRGASLQHLLPMLDQLHPRNQAPFGDERPVPEEANVVRVGCFAEPQLAKAELKYYGEGNGAAFASMYWHARSDGVPFFAMARHADPLGHAFTFRSFEHEAERPKWGVYDGCGTPCADDEAHDCGCANEANRGFPNHDCAQEHEKRFAVYKIKPDGEDDEDAAADSASGPDEDEDIKIDEDKIQDVTTKPASPRTLGDAEAVNHPHWKLSSRFDEDEGEPSIEIVVPQGSRVEAKGDEVHFFDADEGDASPKSPSEGADSGNGKVKLPVGVSPQDCELDVQKTATGGQVLRCKLEKKDVKRLPIRLVGADEL